MRAPWLLLPWIAEAGIPSRSASLRDDWRRVVRVKTSTCSHLFSRMRAQEIALMIFGDQMHSLFAELGRGVARATSTQRAG